MANTFSAGIARLKERIGQGEITGKVRVNQHYALDQHENLQYEHPRGGGPKYLSTPLLSMHEHYLRFIAAQILKTGPVEPMIANMENLQTHLDPAAPIDERPNPIRLRRSGNPIVIDDETEVYNRPPQDPREPFLDPDDEARAHAAEASADPTF